MKHVFFLHLGIARFEDMEESKGRRQLADENSGQSQRFGQRSDGESIEINQETPHGPHAAIRLARPADVSRNRTDQRTREANLQLHVLDD